MHFTLLVGYLGAFLVMLGLMYIPESPIILLEKNRFSEVRDILEKIAMTNRNIKAAAKVKTITFEQEALENHLDDFQRMNINEQSREEVSIDDKVIILTKDFNQVFEVREFRANFLALGALMCTMSVGYYLVNYSVNGLPGNLLNNTVSLQISEMTAYAIAGFGVYSWLGFRKSFVGFFILSLLGGLSVVALKDSESVTVRFMTVFFSKFGVCCNFVIVYVAYARLIPPMYNS